MIRRLILSRAIVALFSMWLFGTTSAQQVRLYPVDEAGKDRSFKIFRDKLIVAVKKHDRRFLLSILDPKIIYSFGDDAGAKGFVKFWKLDSPNSKVWAELLTVLSMGGSFDNENGKKSFYAPYVSSRWEAIQNKIPGDEDAFCCGAIVSSKVKMQRRPDTASPVVSLLSYDVVKMNHEGSIFKDEKQDELLWAKIKTLQGQDGYVRGDQIRSPTDYRASFKKVRGRWVMYVFVAGD